jgi:hypothetical protein
MCTEFTETDHVLSYKTRFHKFKKIEIIQGVVSTYSGLKIENSSKR